LRHLDALTDMHGTLRGQVVHVRGMFPDGLLPALLQEAAQVEAWSTHQKADSWGILGDRIFAHLETIFGVAKVAGRRFNVYRPGQGKPLHQDRNAHSDRAGNVTITASFGAPRCLKLAPLSGEEPLKIWQRDGDVFCFTSQINQSFMHGIEPNQGERASLVLWGDARPLGHIFGSGNLRCMDLADEASGVATRSPRPAPGCG